MALNPESYFRSNFLEKPTGENREPIWYVIFGVIAALIVDVIGHLIANHLHAHFNPSAWDLLYITPIAVIIYLIWSWLRPRSNGRQTPGKAPAPHIPGAYRLLDDEHAIEFHEKQLEIARGIGDRQGEATALYNMSVALDKLGRRSEAIQSAQSALDILEELGSPQFETVRRTLDRLER
jgi:tetratricopeptide (TPR) repeat protein